MTHAVELKNITKRFGHVVANDKVDLYVDNGVIMSLLGENGSGKTTLMNMLAGIYYPDEGQIFVEGKEVSIRSPKDAYENGIGMIHQHFKLIDVFTAAQNVALGIEDGKYECECPYPQYEDVVKAVRGLGYNANMVTNHYGEKVLHISWRDCA